MSFVPIIFIGTKILRGNIDVDHEMSFIEEFN